MEIKSVSQMLDEYLKQKDIHSQERFHWCGICQRPYTYVMGSGLAWCVDHDPMMKMWHMTLVDIADWMAKKNQEEQADARGEAVMNDL